MNIQELLRNMNERLAASANVKNVYGDPVGVGDRTVIPVAEVHYAFGGGGGNARGESEGHGSGGGAGARVTAKPCGALEITPQGTRFILFRDYRKLGLAMAIGFALSGVIVALAGTKRIEVVKRAAR